ncbi:MAG TPA: DUF445 family protein [Clostridiales bacterium]|nr:DUF445 family protein [Clostridiales bacterium]HOL92054.1 DUF445 family protein [Clostridiales bacterium]HPP35943.1 DUF445 family protein [Clostridiales bacterium]
MDIQIITAPVVGGLIGLITNGLAIRMMFRPLKPIYIGRFRLPFTPGLIPKERERLAKSIGEVISRELINKDTLKTTLLSGSMKEQFSAKLDEIIDKYRNSGDTVGSIAEKFFEKEKMQEKLDNAKDVLAQTITKRAIEQDIGRTIVDYAYDEIMSKTKPILKSITASALNSMKKPFANRINDLIASRSKPLIEKFLDGEADELINMPLKDIITKYQDRLPEVKEYLWNVYTDIITKKLEGVLDTVGIAEVVSNKINDFELLELENLVTTLMRKELNALIWLGGLLGLIMGFVNVII